MAYPPVVPLGEGEEPPDLVPEGNDNRAEAAVTYRLAGATYPEIARYAGYTSAFHARQAVEKVLAASSTEESRDRLRGIEGRRLERLLRSTWVRATNPQDPEHLSYLRASLALIDRHVRLFGLDAPQQMVVYSPAQGEIEAWVAGMARAVIEDLPAEANIVGEVVYDIPDSDEPEAFDADAG